MARTEENRVLKLLIVIPAYNEEENIERVVEELQSKYRQYDYLIVNDGSRDRTSEICHRNHYHILDLPINLGLTGAFQTGMKYAYENGYDCVLQFDADGQHLPKYISMMLEKMEEGYDIVIGSRFVDEKKNKSFRMLGSFLISKAIRMTTGRKIADPTSGMRMFNRDMIRKFANNINYEPEPDTISFLVKQGAEVGEVQVHMEERIAGESYLNFSRSMKYMMRVLVSILVVQNFRKRNR